MLYFSKSNPDKIFICLTAIPVSSMSISSPLLPFLLACIPDSAGGVRDDKGAGHSKLSPSIKLTSSLASPFSL